MKRIGRPPTLATREEARQIITARSVRDATGCLLWQGPKDRKGYGTVWFGQRMWRVARLSVWAFKGELAPELPTDHLCRVHACIDADHIRQIPNRENVLIGIGPTAENARKTHCFRGHPFNAKNTKYDSNGYRRCRPCWQIRKKRNRLAIRALLPPEPQGGPGE